ASGRHIVGNSSRTADGGGGVPVAGHLLPAGRQLEQEAASPRPAPPPPGELRDAVEVRIEITVLKVLLVAERTGGDPQRQAAAERAGERERPVRAGVALRAVERRVTDAAVQPPGGNGLPAGG